MKNLSEILKKISVDELQGIKDILGMSETTRNVQQVYNTMLTHHGISLIAASLSRDEQLILHHAYFEKDGISFEELCRRTKLDTKIIEKLADNLSAMLLVHVLKNRQKLSNKMDKIFVLPEIREHLNPAESDAIKKYFAEIFELLESKSVSKSITPEKLKKHIHYKYIENIYETGGILLLEEFLDMTNKKNSEKILSELCDEKLVHVYNDLTDTGKTFVKLDKNIFASLASDLDGSAVTVNVSNGYNMLINQLKAYDIVSTYGLFLTKQKVFRKIDRQHLDESMIKIFAVNGSETDQAAVSQLALYMLYLQDCIKFVNDSLTISLKTITANFNKPLVWLSKILSRIDEQIKEEILFPENPLPSHADIIHVLELIDSYSGKPAGFLESAYFIKSFSRLKGSGFATIKKTRAEIKKSFNNCLEFINMMGLTVVESGLIRLSHAGVRKLHRDLKEVEEIEIKKSMYLNPDFTLIVPKEELSSEAMYHILTHTEIVKDDILLHTKISRDSILTSLKRGMNNEEFFLTLKDHLKTEMPGNLNFLIFEWLNQSISVKIFSANILETNSSFMDKISHSKIKHGIIKRISDEFAVIDIAYLDRIIKMAKENDAVINLFDETERAD